MADRPPTYQQEPPYQEPQQCDFEHDHIEALRALLAAEKQARKVAEELASWLVTEVKGYVPYVQCHYDEDGTIHNAYNLGWAANQKYAELAAEAEEEGSNA